MITTSVAGEDIEENLSVSDKINFNEMTKSEKEMILLDLRKEMIENNTFQSISDQIKFNKAMDYMVDNAKK